MLPAPKLSGCLPGDLNVVTEFAAAIMTDSKNGEAGKA